MATTVTIFAALLDFSKKVIFCKNAANFLEISRNHVVTASKTNIIKNGVGKRNYNTFCQKVKSFVFKL